MTAYIRWLRDIGPDQVNLVGGKGANLGQMLRLGLPVPPGFVVTSEAYRDFIAANALTDAPPQLLRERIPIAPIPRDISTLVVAAYRDLGSASVSTGVAIRSSGTAEDTLTASFAGQHDTFLNVIGEEALLAALRNCWASLWSERAVDYRRQRGWDEHDLALAVVVQAMVPAEWAGVLFTVDPVSGRRDVIVLQAVAGLGEALVSGQATGQRCILDKQSVILLEGNAVLPANALAELAQLANQVEQAFGRPQDIEWAYAGGHCYLLQARPLTAMAEEPKPADFHQPRQYSRIQRAAAPQILDRITMPPYPFDYSLFFHPLLEHVGHALASLGFSTPPVDALFNEVADGVYQIVPPDVRPTLRLLALPFKLIAALRASPELWLQECHATLVVLSEHIDGQDHTTLAESELVQNIVLLSRRQIDLALPRFGVLPRGLLASRALSSLLRLAVGTQAQQFERELLAAVPCITTAANGDLARLAHRISESEPLRQVFQSQAPDQLPALLVESTDGKVLVAEINLFLRRYGLRETAMPSAALPAWRDDPRLVYGLLKGLATGVSVTGVDASGDTRPEMAWHELTASLKGRWLGLGGRLVLGLLLRLLTATRAFLAFREDSHYYLLMPFPVMRRLALELGLRWVQRGALDQPEDIFFLKIDEIKAQSTDGTMREIVRKRKEARGSGQSRYTTVPAGLLAPVTGGGDVAGEPASPGQATGRVRIIRREDDFWLLQQGEVLVAPYTNPTWTPLFALASAVVVDTGGPASHAAIVAREYGIPAVMGASNATSSLRDGQRVLVDGNWGTVVLLED